MQGMPTVQSPTYPQTRSPGHSLTPVPSHSPRPSSASCMHLNELFYSISLYCVIAFMLTYTITSIAGHMLDVGHPGDYGRGGPSPVLSPGSHGPAPSRSPQPSANRIPQPSRGHPNLTVVIPNSRGEVPSASDQMVSRLLLYLYVCVSLACPM